MSALRAASLVLLALLHVSHAACPDFQSASTLTCQILFDHFQASLLERRLNLYNLRKTFLPLTHAPPPLVNVSYQVIITPLSENPCPGSNNDTLGLIPANTTRSEIIFGWTSKTFYSVFHPAQINRLQPQLLYTFLAGLEISSSELVALSWDGVSPILTVQLGLGPVLLPCRPTGAEVLSSLSDLTSLLGVYADKQENITEWRNEDLGIILSGLVFVPNWYFYTYVVYPNSSIVPLINIVFAIILSLVLSIAAYYYIWKKIPSSPRERNFILGHTLLWTAVVIILQLTIYLLIFEVIRLSEWCLASTCSEPAAQSKFYLLIYIGLSNVVVFTVFLYYYLRGRLRPKQHLIPGIQPFVVGFPLVSIVAALTILVFRVFIKPCKRRYNWIRYGAIHLYETLHYFITCPRWALIHGYKILRFVLIFLPFTTIFTFLAIFIFSIIPVLLQALVYPFRILAAYSFFFVNIMLFFMVTFIVNFVWKKKGIKNTSNKLCFLLLLPTVVIILILMINVPFILLYQLLTSGTLTDNPFTLGVISIAPTLILSSPLVWLLKNKIIPKFVDEASVEEESEGEGRIASHSASIAAQPGKCREGEKEEGSANEVHVVFEAIQNPSVVEETLPTDETKM